MDHDVVVADNLARRTYDEELGVTSLVPISTLERRVSVWENVSGHEIPMLVGDLTDPVFTRELIGDVRPDAIVDFAEQRSAPYSMIDQAHAVYTQFNNVMGTLNVLYSVAEIDPTIHLVKLGSMGEYGTPNIDIEEGWLEITHKGRTDTVLYPKRPGSFYHLSKVHDSHNIEFACRTWNLRATDLNQGIVYGQETDETRTHRELATRFDYDAVFGTVLNRMVIQAVCGHPLTVYGTGHQIRGMLDIRDTVECIRLAVEHPADPGEFRVFNQFTEQFSVLGLAEAIRDAYPGPVRIAKIDNPRVEAAEHYYHAAHTKLVDLGLEPHLLDDTLIESLFVIARRHKGRADPSLFEPSVQWAATSSRVGPDAIAVHAA
jgi:UDP-sulfoquinovose synthase